MYLRTVRAKGAEEVEFEYLRLVEAYWEKGRSKQQARWVFHIARLYNAWYSDRIQPCSRERKT
jgi:hypothetical protein